MDLTSDDPVSIVSTQSGGAFGQPLIINYSVQTSGGEVYEGTNEGHANEVADALREAFRMLGGSHDSAPGPQDPTEPRGGP